MRDDSQAITWNLFVDESGDFADEADDVVVAGVLVRSDVPGARAEDLRDAFRRALPHLPWPFHARSYNQGVYLALAVEAHAGRGGAMPAWRLDTAKQVLSALRRVDATRLSEARRSLAAGDEPDYETLRWLSARADLATQEALRQLRQETRRTMVRVIEALARGAGGFDGLATAFVSSADGAPGEFCGRVEQRYLEHLDNLFERTHDLLRRQGGRHEVRLHVLQRNVDDPLLGKGSPMHLRQVRPLAVAQSSASVVIVAESVVPFDTKVHPLLVVADLAANRARAALRHHRALVGLERALAEDIRLPLRSGSPRLTHVAATGVPRAVVAGRADAAGLSRHHEWARQQALEWAAAHGGAR